MHSTFCKRWLGCATAFLLLARPASADPNIAIAGVQATTSTTTATGTPTVGTIQSTADGSNLSSYSLSATDLTSGPNNSVDSSHLWLSETAVGDGQTVTFNYHFSGGLQTVDEIAFWNYNTDDTLDSGSTIANYRLGMDDVSFSYSTDGVAYVPIPGAPTTFTEAVVGNHDGPQIITLAPIQAVDIEMTVDETFYTATETFLGQHQTPIGYNAILFGTPDVSGVPELDWRGSGMACALLALGALVLGETRKRVGPREHA